MCHVLRQRIFSAHILRTRETIIRWIGTTWIAAPARTVGARVRKGEEVDFPRAGGGEVCRGEMSRAESDRVVSAAGDVVLAPRLLRALELGVSALELCKLLLLLLLLLLLALELGVVPRERWLRSEWLRAELSRLQRESCDMQREHLSAPLHQHTRILSGLAHAPLP